MAAQHPDADLNLGVGPQDEAVGRTRPITQAEAVRTVAVQSRVVTVLVDRYVVQRWYEFIEEVRDAKFGGNLLGGAGSTDLIA